jgi:phenylacetate-CoA ligase
MTARGCRERIGSVSELSTSDFEADRQRHLRAFAAGLEGEAERLTWPLERLHGLRDARLRALLRTAVTRSPWHRRRLAGVDPDAVTGADLALLPTMTKADVMEHWDEIVTDRRLSLGLAERHLERVAKEGPAYLCSEFQVVTTGGSSGSRGVFVWDFEGWLSFGLSRDRTTLWLAQHAGGGADMRRAFVAAAHATHPTSIVTRTFAGSPQLGVSRSFPVTLPLSEIVMGLNDFRPTHLFAYPSMMHRLAGELRAGRLRISPRELNCGAEPLVADARVQIETAFARPVINLYAAAETGVIARSYPGSSGLHLNEDIAVYEPVDARDRPVPAGTRGAKLLVTNVVNHALPLIRYELSDEVTMLVEPNPGPWTGRRIADPEGRVDGVFAYDGGVEVHLHLFRSALGRRRHVLEYQVRQTPAGADIAVRTVAPLNCDALRRELVEGLATLGITAPQVRIDAVDEIERAGSTGKLRRFVPLAHERR